MPCKAKRHWTLSSVCDRVSEWSFKSWLRQFSWILFCIMNTTNALNFLYAPKKEEAYDLANIISHLKQSYTSSSYETCTLRIMLPWKSIKCNASILTKGFKISSCSESYFTKLPTCPQCRSYGLFESHAWLIHVVWSGSQKQDTDLQMLFIPFSLDKDLFLIFVWTCSW